MNEGKKQLNQNVQVAKKQHAYLFHCSKDAERSLILFKKLRRKEFTTGTTKQDNWLEEILLSQIIIKLHSIFDKSRDAVCLENFLTNNAVHITKKENMENISDKLKDINKKYSLLIKQLEYNRHENAHIPSRTKLGVIEKIAIKIRKLGKVLNNQDYINQKSVPHEKRRFSVGNFPVEKATELSNQLSEIIWGILYPGTINKK